MADLDMSPAEAALKRDLSSLAFRIGERKGRWRLVRLAFPYAYFQVAAGERATGPSHFLLRVECNGYRATAPTSVLWDGREDVPLADDLLPRTAAGGIVISFTKSCGQCLYHPIDRLARSHWPDAHHDLAWAEDSTITTLLETVHALVHQGDYCSSLAPEAAAVLPGSALGLAAE